MTGIKQFTDIDTHIYRIGGSKLQSGIGPEQIGNKAWNLLRMDRIGLPVPSAIVLGTELCRRYIKDGKRLPGLGDALVEHLAWMEKASGTGFGDRRRPLLVSVRSGSPVSMPGMMDTILNIGLNDETVRGVIRMTGNARLAWDCYRRLVQSYCEVVHGARPDSFDRIVNHHIRLLQLTGPEELDTHTLQGICNEFLDISTAVIGQPFPQDPYEQLQNAVYAVFGSWMSDKAVKYRQLNSLDDHSGTAVTVQTMVFGNAGVTSGSGVGFTRDPATGDNEMYIDFLFDAQGEDVVSGRRTVQDSMGMQQLMPELLAQLEGVKKTLEKEFRDLQDFEFTVQNKRLYLLQSRNAKRTPHAAVQVAVDLVREQLIDTREALERLRSIDLDRIKQLHLVLPPGVQEIGRAVPASTGVAVGAVALSSDAAIRISRNGEPVLLVRKDMATEDIDGLAISEGIISCAGFRTSHAAVVARQLGKVCLVACEGLHIDMENKTFTLSGQRFREGEYLSLDGQTGAVYAGKLPVEQSEPVEALGEIRRWQDQAGEAPDFDGAERGYSST